MECFNEKYYNCGRASKEYFLSSITVIMINKYGKGAVLQLQLLLDPFPMLLVEVASELGLFIHLSNHVFGSP